MSFIDMLYNRNAFPPPPRGAGRIHTIDDVEDEIPDRLQRLLDILEALRAGEGNADTIRRRLSYGMPKTMLIADVEELMEQGRVVIRRTGSQAIYALAEVS